MKVLLVALVTVVVGLVLLGVGKTIYNQGVEDGEVIGWRQPRIILPSGNDSHITGEDFERELAKAIIEGIKKADIHFEFDSNGPSSGNISISYERLPVGE